MSLRLTFTFYVASALVAAACTRSNNAADTAAVVPTAGVVMPVPGTPVPDTTATTKVAAGEVAVSTDVSAWNDDNIVAALEAENQAEIGLARIAERLATRNDVKDLARMLVDDHSRLLYSTKQLAESKNLSAEPAPNDTTLTTMSNDERRFMSMPRGASWDSAYVDHEVGGHERTIAQVEAMQQRARHPQLKHAIGEALSTLRKHLDRARQLQSVMTSGDSMNIVPARRDTTASGRTPKTRGR